MKAAEHDPKIAKARGISHEVAREFIEADEKAGIWQTKPTKDNPMGRIDGKFAKYAPKKE